MNIPHNLPTIGREEKIALLRTLKTNWIGPGKEVAQFENYIENLFELSSGCVIAVSSGTAALHMTLASIPRKNNLVAIPAYSCVSIEQAVRASGRAPRHIDSEINSPLMLHENQNPDELDALIGVSTFGFHFTFQQSASYLRVADITHSFGKAKSGSKRTFSGDVAVASLGATKLMTSGGQGGVVICKSPEIAKEIRDFRDFDMKRDERHRLNYQMTDLQAAFGRIQVARLEEFIDKRNAIREIYSHRLNTGLGFEKNSVPYRFLVSSSNPNALIDWLSTNGVSAIIPYEKSEMIDHLQEHPNAKIFTEQYVSIPLYPKLKIRNAKKIASLIEEFENIQ